MIDRSLAPSTASTYRVGIRRYLTFCTNLHVQPVPASKRLVAAFASHLSSLVTLPTIRVYLAAVSFLHESEGCRSPVRGNPILRLTLRGIRRSNLDSPPKSRRRPITPRMLCKLLRSSRDSRSLRSRDKQMFRAAATLAFFGFLRIGEFTVTPHRPVPLSKGDILLSNHEMQVGLRHSKTDQWGRGAFVKIGCSRDSCCPVQAMEQYLKQDRRPTSAPLFQDTNGTALTARAFRSWLHRHLARIGLNPRLFNTHSFRIGAATAAAKAGLPEKKIMELGRWRSKAFETYVRYTPKHSSAAAMMAKV